jgi:hypothetical protein
MPENKPSGFEWRGTTPLTDENGNLDNSAGQFITDEENLTDGTPARSYIVDSGAVNDLLGFLLSDKGCTLTVYPLPFAGSDQRATASEVLTIADGGVTEAATWRYSEVGTPRSEIVVTKTEAGDTTSYGFTARGR